MRVNVRTEIVFRTAQHVEHLRVQADEFGTQPSVGV
jgi:hypothetical protein